MYRDAYELTGQVLLSRTFYYIRGAYNVTELDLRRLQLTDEEVSTLQEMRKRCARRILLSTTLSASGHPGGSLSALDMLLVPMVSLSITPRNHVLQEETGWS